MFGFEDAFLRRAGSFGVLAAEFFAIMAGGVAGLAFALLQRSKQPFPGKLPVHGLGTGILHRDGHIGRQMAQRHAGGDFIHVLAAGTRRTGEGLLQLRFVEMGDWLHDFTARPYKLNISWFANDRQAGEKPMTCHSLAFFTGNDSG